MVSGMGVNLDDKRFSRVGEGVGLERDSEM